MRVTFLTLFSLVLSTSAIGVKRVAKDSGGEYRELQEKELD